jgi:predicted AlkP superfamily phosphohydrolase/phosphomutase
VPIDSGAGRRVALVGIDGFSPEWIETFLDEGSMPNLEKIRRSGATAPLLSTLPATTPVAWASIATGCHPSATGIEGFLIHLPGDALDRRVSGVYATRCRREPLWETATLWGKRSFVVKFPLSYPSRTATLRVDGAAGWGGIVCLHQACASGVADSQSPTLTSGFELPGDGIGPSFAHRWRGRLRIATLWGGPPLMLDCALTDEMRLALSPSGSWEDAVTLGLGEWSGHLVVQAHGRFGEEACTIRLKLLELDPSPPEAPSLRLFHGPVHALGQHSHPSVLADLHLTVAGPVEEETEPTLLLEGLIDFDTHIERCRFNSEWLQRLSANILASEDWDLFMVQIHIVDWAHHLLQGQIDPRHPLHDPVGRPAAVERLRAHYRLADDLVGAVAAQLRGDDAIVVVGDHGQDLHHTTIRLNEAFAQRGWLRWTEAGEVDWAGTRVYAAGNYVYLNSLGREPEGLVAAAEAEPLMADICAQLVALTDPRTGARPVRVAGRKEEFAHLGADGAGTGDIIFCLESGYQARNDRGPVFELTVPGREFSSGHDHFYPPDPRIESRLYASGGMFAAGASSGRRSVVDVYPTLCAALGIEPSVECQGKAIEAILVDPSAMAGPVETPAADLIACR